MRFSESEPRILVSLYLTYSHISVNLPRVVRTDMKICQHELKMFQLEQEICVYRRGFMQGFICFRNVQRQEEKVEENQKK